jgi:hypothetical protein
VPSQYKEYYNDTAWWDKQYDEHYNDCAVGWVGETTDEGGSSSEEPPSSLAYI